MTSTEGPYRERVDTVVESPLVGVQGRAESGVGPATALNGTGHIRRASETRFSPDAVIAALVGLVLLVVGLIAITRGGFDGPMSTPVVNVLGFTHTTTLGLIEIALGVCLLVSGAARSRSGAIFVGGLLGIGGFVGAVQTESFRRSLELESSMALIAVIAGAVVVLSALMLPRYARRSTSITPT